MANKSLLIIRLTLFHILHAPLCFKILEPNENNELHTHYFLQGYPFEYVLYVIQAWYALLCHIYRLFLQCLSGSDVMPRQYQSSASLAFVRGIPWWLVYPHYWSKIVCSWINIRHISLMRASLMACREPARKLWQLCKVLIVFEHKTQYLLIHAPLPDLWYFDTSVMYPQWFRRVKFVVLPPRFV